MLEYLDKFTKLPADIQQKASSQEVLLALDELSSRYNVDLASFVMRVMVGDLMYRNMLASLIKEFDMELDQAELLEAELRDRVFKKVQDYLLGTAKPEPATEEEIKEVETVVEKAEKEEINIKKLPEGEEEKLLMAPKNDLDEKKVKSVPVEKPLVAEEEKEITEIKKKMPVGQETEADRYSRVAADVLEESGLNMPSEGLNLRFKQIMITYLKGIRTKIETRETMTKPVISGGLNLDNPEVERIIAIANKKLAEENKRAPLGKVKIEEGPSGFVFKKEEIAEALGKVPPKPKDEKGMTMTGEEYDLAAEIKKGNVSASASASASTPKQQPETTQRKAKVVGGKKAMDDIKTPQIMSPIDELAYMDLVTFRRLDSDPVRRCKKIEDKIGLLAKEGIDRQLEGIKAWRLNPVNKTYISMGQDSITQGKGIDDIIVDLKNKGFNYLTRVEFEAIMDLNNRLRF